MRRLLEHCDKGPLAALPLGHSPNASSTKHRPTAHNFLMVTTRTPGSTELRVSPYPQNTRAVRRLLSFNICPDKHRADTEHTPIAANHAHQATNRCLTRSRRLCWRGPMGAFHVQSRRLGACPPLIGSGSPAAHVGCACQLRSVAAVTHIH